MMGHYAQAIALDEPDYVNRRYEDAGFVKSYRNVRQVFLFKDIVNDRPHAF